ncbi:MAG TPA: DUF924 family protein [Bauldia sp.]|nr:DUF924 family protein [Bauldia sp.]
MDTAPLRDIYRYWFGELSGPEHLPQEKFDLWFNRSDETDTFIRETWLGYLRRAGEAAWDLDRLGREEQVALVVLFDQFPRNIFRVFGEAFAYDGKARAIANELIAGGIDRFYLVERVSLVLPLEHSEDIADQDRCVLLFANAAVNGPAAWLNYNRNQLDYGTRHRDLIRRFGRFPHRNELLGRTSTAEEIEFLKGGRGY